MEASFWQQRWANNEIAFHESEGNRFLIKYFGQLKVKAGGRVFVPLCGKTRDIAWLLANGYCVVGVELVATAIEQLFAELGTVPTIARINDISHYSAKDIDIYVGDIFAVSRNMLGDVDAIYDRAALVALPKEMREQYTAHLLAMTNNAPQLLITFEYDQKAMDGPPFSVSKAEVNQHYRQTYELSLKASKAVPGGLKGKCEAIEDVWLLRPL